MKLKTVLVFFIFILTSFFLNSQETILLTKEQKQKRIDKSIEIVRKASDHILGLNNFLIVDSKSKERISTLSLDKVNENMRVENRYNSMHYINGPLISGLIKASEILQDEKYYNHSIEYYKFIFDNAPLFRSVFEKGTDKDFAFRRFFDMKYKDGCCSLAAGLTDVDYLHSREDVQDYFKRAINFLYHTHPRMEDGTLARDWPNMHTIWADDLYMLIPFLVRMGKISGESKYFDDAVKQVEQYNKYLFDEYSGLYFHGYFSDIKENNSARWLRANGWIAMAQVEIIDFLPDNHPKKQLLIGYLQRQIIGFSKYQDISGLWRQLLDKPDSYIETSGSAMFIYAIARAVNNGWVDYLYFRIADEGWKGLIQQITENGVMRNVCVGTGLAQDLVFYYKRPVYKVEQKSAGSHGVGALLLAAYEMIRGYEMDYPTTRKGGGY